MIRDGSRAFVYNDLPERYTDLNMAWKACFFHMVHVSIFFAARTENIQTIFVDLVNAMLNLHVEQIMGFLGLSILSFVSPCRSLVRVRDDIFRHCCWCPQPSPDCWSLRTLPPPRKQTASSGQRGAETERLWDH